MLLGFQPRFEPHVQDGSKPHTIRERRKRRPRVGEPAHCFGNLRRRGPARLLGRWEITRVQDIAITVNTRGAGSVIEIAIDGVKLTADEAEKFAWRDGFRQPGRGSLQQMLDFWMDLDRLLPWEGDLIHWDPEKPVAWPAKKQPRRKLAA